MSAFNHFIKLCQNAIALSFFILFFVISDSRAGETAPYQPLPPDTSPYQASISVNLTQTITTNKRLLGNNTQWVDRGDELLISGSTDFSPHILEKVKELKPTVLRYPGGALSDLYHWESGMGTLKDRQKLSLFHRDGEDTVLFGTEEFLLLCRLVGAEALLTANVITAPPEEVAAWIKKINIDRLISDDQLLPKVGFVEIGNEPYLIDDNQKSLAITPQEYAKRATTLVAQLRNVDPSIKIGIPLRSDDFDGMPVTPMPGFNKEVLEGFSGTIDFVSLHNTYFPFFWGAIPSNKEQIYLALMAAVQVVKKDLNQTRQQLSTLRKEASIPIAITELNSMFSIGKGETDGYIQTLAGAIYIADLLTMLSQEPDILMANFWSLTGNWEFGAIDQSGNERASFKVLVKFHEMLDGKHIASTVSSPSFDIIGTGAITAQTEVSYISALGTIKQEDSDHSLLKLWVINKHPLKPVNLSLKTGGTLVSLDYSIETLTTKNYFSLTEAEQMDWEKVAFENEKNTFMTLDPHSVNLIKISIPETLLTPSPPLSPALELSYLSDQIR